MEVFTPGPNRQDREWEMWRQNGSADPVAAAIIRQAATPEQSASVQGDGQVIYESYSGPDFGGIAFGD